MSRVASATSVITPLLEMAMTGQLDDLEGDDLYSTNICRAKLAAVRVAEGVPVVKHRNGKIDLGILLDDAVPREYVCHHCQHSFAYKHVLDRHVKRIHEKHLMTTYQCPKCSYHSVWKDQMRSHFSVVHQNFKPFLCSECDFRAPKPCRVSSHILRCHNGVGSCAFDSELRPRSVSPTRTISRPIPKSCKRLAPSRREQLCEVSMEIGDEILPFGTGIIKQEVEQKPGSSDYSEDDDEKGDDESSSGFHCPFCSFKSPSQLGMGEHVIETHEQSDRSRSRANQLFTCQLCNKMYQTTFTLEQHYKKDHPHVILVVPGKTK